MVKWAGSSQNGGLLTRLFRSVAGAPIAGVRIGILGELAPKLFPLGTLKVAHGHPAPAVSGLDQDGKDQLHGALLVQQSADDCGAAPLCFEAAAHRHEQVGQGSVQIVGEAGHG